MMDLEDVELKMELEDVLGRMVKKLNTRKRVSLPCITQEVFNRLEVTQRPGYFTPQPKDHLDKLIQASHDAASDHFMSSTGLHSLLQMVKEHTVVPSSEAYGHLWIDAFMYRAIAMTSPGKHLLLNLEYPVVSKDVSATSREETFGGVVDYVVMLVDKVHQSAIILAIDIYAMH
ncbi:hypothetical protein EWM64_g8128 [Hericium alpestre]|uniref:Uncharacterized protein n=1 Tax=Hericium alpestre TaxID=135208 RepID=A0A4Y9ZNQ0_9AGAM|nr:hypothetical protein EWM64_g8128 [Hericium alpestre]